jgi:asparagine synthetase B (glutamine-hydrolysing)
MGLYSNYYQVARGLESGVFDSVQNVLVADHVVGALLSGGLAEAVDGA